MNTKRLPALCIGLLLAGSAAVYAQTVSLGSNKVTLKTAFDKIEQGSKYRIAYNSSEIDASRIVTIPKAQGDALEMLKLVLQNANCEYEINGNYVTLHPKQPKPSTKQSNNDNKRKISGNILDTTGEPIIGATVMVKGTNNATVTNIEGNYTLTDVPDNAEISISYIGFQTVTLKATDRNLAKITMKEDGQALSEVVVVGYGTQKRANLTGAVATISSDDINNRPVTTAL